MIKFLIATGRRPGMTQAEFHHVKHVHAPLALQDADAEELIRKYTQNHLSDSAYGAPGTAFVIALKIRLEEQARGDRPGA